MRVIFDAIRSVQGPLTLVAFLAALIFGICYTVVKNKHGLDFLYNVISQKVTRNAFYKLASQLLLYLFILSCVALVLGFGTWCVTTLLGNPQKVGKAQLRLESIKFNENGQIDVIVVNNGMVAAVINRVDCKIIKDHKSTLSPLIVGIAIPIPLNDAQEGETRGTDTAISVPGEGAERILIDIKTTRVLTVQVSMSYGSGQVVHGNVETSSDS